MAQVWPKTRRFGKMTSTTIDRENPVAEVAGEFSWKLSKLEQVATASLVEDITAAVVSFGERIGWFSATREDVHDEDLRELDKAITRTLLLEGPVFPRLLAARRTESFLCGDRKCGEADPPEDGTLGQTIADYMQMVSPVERLRLYGEWPGIFFPKELPGSV
jgi:hypothetical protein